MKDNQKQKGIEEKQKLKGIKVSSELHYFFKKMALENGTTVVGLMENIRADLDENKIVIMKNRDKKNNLL